ncbi:uncharacterized protein LOC110851585 [Folsomia candida]|uniref:Cadherin EGF LAG seven-pass G-type receptor 3 n=1 Tax=Folsomia candida TaxID=158441 RepID=A0A226E2P2_FOLCA|nr:uncharacterized protein LOC110851585 [Folsomia candida]OXA51540.1 Cadherin EGF LAG seven-pass G-type receptor 3 [Folsomia candida]
MEKLLIEIIVILATTAMLVSTNAIPPSPHTTKSEICPHGVHYIDACKNACSCDPQRGGAICSRMTNCDDSDGVCPFGATFTDPLWGSNFKCQCNKDNSQTYECFNLLNLSNYFLYYKRRILETLEG